MYVNVYMTYIHIVHVPFFEFKLPKARVQKNNLRNQRRHQKSRTKRDH